MKKPIVKWFGWGGGGWMHHLLHTMHAYSVEYMQLHNN